VSLDERPRGSTRPTPKVHYNSLPKTSIEGALGAWTAVPNVGQGHRTYPPKCLEGEFSEVRLNPILRSSQVECIHEVTW
jgi:hypothetical protein